MTTFPQTPSTADSLARFVAGLPKAELHVHHVGSASPQTVARLAERHAGDTRVPADPALLADYFTFTDFAHFIEVYLSVVDLVRDEDDVASLTYDIGVGLAAQQVRYAELTMTPYTSIVRGIAPEAYCEAIEDARVRVARDTGLELRWCFDIPGESGLPAAEVTLEVALGLRRARGKQRRCGKGDHKSSHALSFLAVLDREMSIDARAVPVMPAEFGVVG